MINSVSNTPSFKGIFVLKGLTRDFNGILLDELQNYGNVVKRFKYNLEKDVYTIVTKEEAADKVDIPLLSTLADICMDNHGATFKYIREFKKYVKPKSQP